MLGSTTPRLFTPPLVTGPPGPCGCGCALTPATTDGFDVEEFARDMLRRPLDPWQRWLAIHALEWLQDGSGRPRFRTVLVLAARQNGKTELPVILSLYWQFIVGVPLVLGTSTKLDYAKESWTKAVRLAETSDDPDIIELRGSQRWTRDTNGEQESWTTEGARYKIAASNAQGGRSLTVHRLILDELRQHKTYVAWNAAVPATDAVWDAQIWAMTNAGDDQSVVLNDQRDAALTFIECGEGDPRLGLFEWSTPEDANPLDVHALAMANPNLNRRLDADALLGRARVAVAKGGEVLTGFKTESMCVRVRHLNPALDAGAWRRCESPGKPPVGVRLALALDVAPDQQHATAVVAAVLADGRVRIGVAKAWDGPAEMKRLRREWRALVAAVKPAVAGWLPAGPAAAYAADLATRKAPATSKAWPPPGVKIEEIKGEVPAVCMGFAEAVTAEQIAHDADPLLEAQVGAVEWLQRGADLRVFSRKGDGHCDAVYAAAAAVHLARTLPPPVGKPRILRAVPRP